MNEMPPGRSASTAHAEGPFLGREDELAELTERLAPEGALVTLIGCPGVGTSRMGREVANRSFTRTRIVAATALGSVRAAELREIELLVVDDVDGRVLDVLEELEMLRQDAPSLRVLVIGDEALGLDDEQVKVLDVLAEDAAVRLYMEHLPEATRSSAVEGDVRELVRRASGLTLAVELAALQAETFSARDLLGPAGTDGALDHARLRTSRRSWSSRRSSLAGAFDAACEGLGPAEQGVLAALTTFAGPPRLEDVDAMIDPSITADPLTALETLVRRQLVRRAGLRPDARVDGSSRLELAPLLADHVRRRIRGDERFTGLPRRHAEVVLARLEALEPRLYGPGALEALVELGATLPDVRTAFARMRAGAPGVAARLVVPLADLATFARGISTADPLFAAAVIAADATRDRVLRARTRHVRARMLLEQNQPAAAIALLHEASDLRPRNDVTQTTLGGDLDRTQGWAELASLDLDGATEHFERALEDHRKTRFARGQADACAGLAMVARLRGDEARALRLFESSYGIHLVAGDLLRQGKLREMARLVGLELPEAAGVDLGAAELRATADDHRASGRPWRDAIARLELARKLAQQGDRAASRVSLTEARASAELAGGRAEWIASLAADVPVDEVRSWCIADDATTVISPEGARVDLRTRPVLRRILAALTSVRIAAPGRSLGVEAMLAAGWPGEKVQHAAGLLRVYTAIKRLRALGLQTLVCTSEDGYLLDAGVPVEVSAASVAAR